MKKIFCICSVFVFLIGCEAEDLIDKISSPSESATLGAGTYLSACTVNGLDGEQTTIVLGQDGSFSNTERLYVGSTDCSNVGSVSSESLGTYTLSGVDLLGSSYLEAVINGAPETAYVPYNFDGSTLYIGADVDDISGDVSSIFSAFIADPAGTSDLVLTLQD